MLSHISELHTHFNIKIKTHANEYIHVIKKVCVLVQNRIQFQYPFVIISKKKSSHIAFIKK
jgi:hypothetical protein